MQQIFKFDEKYTKSIYNFIIFCQTDDGWICMKEVKKQYLLRDVVTLFISVGQGRPEVLI